MPLQLPQFYKFKFFYSSRNPIATNALLIIDDHSDASSSHATFPSSPPLFSHGCFDISNHVSFPSSPHLFSPCISNPSNQDEDIVMSMSESCTPLEKGLLIAQSKLGVKNIYM
jgi:hypothetical protein